MSFPSQKRNHPRRWLFVVPLLIPACLWLQGFFFSPPTSLLWTLTDNSANTIQSVIFSADGRTLVSGGGAQGTNSGEVVLRDVGTQQVKQRLKARDVGVVVFSPDKKILVAGAKIFGNGMKEIGGEIRLWNVQTGTLLRKWVIEDHPIINISFFKNGKILMSGGADGTIRLWDVQTGKLVRILLRAKVPFYSVAFSSDGKIIGSANVGEVVLWDAQTGKMLRKLRGHRSKVRSIAFSPDGKTVASGSFDDTVKIWDVKSGMLLHTLSTDQAAVVTDVAFSPDGKTLASGYLRRTIILWSVQTGKILRVVDKKRAGRINALSFSPDGQVLTSSDNSTISAWDVSSLK